MPRKLIAYFSAYEVHAAATKNAPSGPPKISADAALSLQLLRRAEGSKHSTSQASTPGGHAVLGSEGAVVGFEN